MGDKGIETPQDFTSEKKFKAEEQSLLHQFLQKQIDEKRQREIEEKARKEREDAEDEARIKREQDEIIRQRYIENDQWRAFKAKNKLNDFDDNLGKKHQDSFMDNIVIKAPKESKGDEYWQANKAVKSNFDHFPQDLKVGELQRILELKFLNSQTELKRVFHENMREIKHEIDSKQVNMAKHLRELKDLAQREREEKDKLQYEVDKLNREKVNLAERYL